ncbi:IclR family transcriptional regulator [Natrialba taiwanensis]|nr:IclR family transcriptional regulator [Natrialba taiwanensis]
MTDADSRSYRMLKTLSVASDVIEVLTARDGATITELADQLDLSKSSAYRYLKTLKELGYVTCTDGCYELSYQFLLLGEYTRNTSELYQVGKSKVDDLAAELGHYAHLVTEADSYGVNLHQATGEEATDYDYQAAKLQQRDPLHVTAAGKAILAHMSSERIEAIVESSTFEQRTKNTITDRERLYNELEAVRQQGFAHNDEEEIKGFRAIGAPIRDHEDRVLGSVSVSAPTSYLSGDAFTDDVPDLVMETANVIEVDFNMTQKQNSITGIS